MKKQSRIGFIIAALVMIPAFHMPIWTITVSSPAMESNLGLYIWIDDITGHNQGDVEKINLVNDYLGKAHFDLEGDTILKRMPDIAYGLIGAAVLIAIVGFRWMGWIWVIFFAALIAYGLTEALMWAYNYAQSMDPRTIVQLPEALSPTRPGSAEMLKVSATSWPYWGSAWIGLSLVVGIMVTWWDR